MTYARKLGTLAAISWLACTMPAAAQDGFQYEDDTATDDTAPDGAASDDAATEDAIDEDTSVAMESESGPQERPVHVSVGAKLGVGGNYLAAPDNPLMQSGYFDDGAGGFGIGGGIFGEARFLNGHLGAELGFIFDSSSNTSKYTFNGNDVNPGWSALDMRMPVLINAGTSDESLRLAIGTGPEFAFPLSASGNVSSSAGDVSIPSRTQTHVNWLINLGLAAPLGPVKLSFDIRFAYNLGMPSNYADRYNLTTGVLAQHQMDLRLLFGVAYDVLK